MQGLRRVGVCLGQGLPDARPSLPPSWPHPAPPTAGYSVFPIWAIDPALLEPFSWPCEQMWSRSVQKPTLGLSRLGASCRSPAVGTDSRRPPATASGEGPTGVELGGPAGLASQGKWGGRSSSHSGRAGAGANQVMVFLVSWVQGSGGAGLGCT